MLTETQFYDRLASVYDAMNDWQVRLDAEMPFILALLRQHSVDRVLDCGCGTGRHAVALAQNGFAVAACDTSPQMIERARQHASHSGVRIDFRVAQIRDLGSAFRDHFDAVLCLGNTFPHILSDDEARSSLSAIQSRLRANGMLIMQSLNYDKRLKEKPRWFGVNAGNAEGRDTLIWRFADYGDSLITFNIALFTREQTGNWSADVQSTLQRPYQRRELESLMIESGFHDFSFSGNLQGAAFEEASSTDLIIVANA